MSLDFTADLLPSLDYTAQCVHQRQTFKQFYDPLKSVMLNIFFLVSLVHFSFGALEKKMFCMTHTKPAVIIYVGSYNYDFFVMTVLSIIKCMCMFFKWLMSVKLLEVGTFSYLKRFTSAKWTMNARWPICERKMNDWFRVPWDISLHCVSFIIRKL